MTEEQQAQVAGLVERVRLPDEEIWEKLNIPPEERHLRFARGEFAAFKDGAQAQLNKVLKEDLALIDGDIKNKLEALLLTITRRYRDGSETKHTTKMLEGDVNSVLSLLIPLAGLKEEEIKIGEPMSPEDTDPHQKVDPRAY